MISAREQFFANTAPTSAASVGLGIEIVGGMPPVYNSTTMPLKAANGNDGRRESKTTSNSQTDMHEHTAKVNTLEEKDAGRFSNLPSRDPVDMQFNNLSLTVNLGFRKGKGIENAKPIYQTFDNIFVLHHFYHLLILLMLLAIFYAIVTFYSQIHLHYYFIAGNSR